MPPPSPGPPPPATPPVVNELATVREAEAVCVRSPILDTILRWVKPAGPDDDPSPSTSSSNAGGPLRRFRVLSAAYPVHTWQGKEGKRLVVRYPDNTVSTSKYSVITFLPRALLEQFRRLANVYFGVISVLMLIGTYSTLFESPLTPYTTLIPLCVVLAITMAKEAFEDVKRHTADQKTNNRAARSLALAGAEEETLCWKDIAVGRIVKVLDKEEIPADMILLTSSEPGGNCYIETSNIDGETNLKIKEAARTGQSGPAFHEAQDLAGWDACLECEAPNSRIHTYTGTLVWQGRRVPVDQANLLLRGSRLRNTKWVLGLVVYTGYDTKIVMNSRAAPSKLSTIEVTTNRLLYLILGMQVLLVTVALGAYLVWTDAHQAQLHYLCYSFLDSPSSFLRMNCKPSDRETSDLGMWVTFLLLYNNMVPISLYVTVEMVNYFQAFFIDQDLEMYDAASDTPALARTSNMNGDLGSVRYVFSDKTGTLTRNIMEFRRCSVAGEIYGNLEVEDEEEEGGEEEEPEQIQSEEERRSDSTSRSGSMGSRRRRWADPFVVRGKALSDLAQQSSAGGKDVHKAAQYFAECLSVCHTVVVEKALQAEEEEAAAGGEEAASPPQNHYQAESPDEEALVDAAASQLGWVFVGRTPSEAHVLDPQGTRLTYQVLAVLSFTSTRKRMSVVVRTPEGRIVLLTKGADNVVFARSTAFLGTTHAALDAHLSVFAADGLRTLVLARKEISEAEFKAWHTDFQQAATAVDDRAERMAEVGEVLEQGLTVVGATAIEDKLQEGVPDTIAHLLEAGIKVWVLTGDKVETAINIAYSCRLLNSAMVLVKITDKGDGDDDEAAATEALRQQLRKLVAHFEVLVEDEGLKGGLWSQGAGGWLPWRTWWQAWRKAHGRRRSSALSFTRVNVPAPLGDFVSSDMLTEPLGLEPQPDALLRNGAPLEDLQSDHLALIIDGPALARVFGDWEMERLLLRVATLCKSVVACRVSPAQKRMLIRLVKKGVRRPTPITLAIGDGANDVAMIQEAQIGVGISGREGRQAVNSADFAIAQFRFLEPLLLKHGRWSYRRISKVILYSFYKNIVLTIVLFAYTFFTGFSGQSLFEDFVYTGYNFFLAMPIICVGFFDRDLAWGTITGKEGGGGKGFRWAYMSGRENLDLNLGQMALWLLQAVIDSVLIFGFSFGAMRGSRQVLSVDGDADDLYVLGLIAYTGMLVGMLYKAATNTYTWTWVNHFFFWGSALLYVMFLAVYGALPLVAGGFFGVPGHMGQHASFWLIGVLLVPTVSVIVDYVFVYLRLSFFPSPVDIAMEHDRGFYVPDRAAAPPLDEHDAAERASLKAAEETEVEEEEQERRRSGWYPGKYLVGLQLLRRLNARVSAKDKEEMGISEAPTSSYDYTSTSMDLGPGAGSNASVAGGGAGGGLSVRRRSNDE